jgi:hypothetical protein
MAADHVKPASSWRTSNSLPFIELLPFERGCQPGANGSSAYFYCHPYACSRRDIGAVQHLHFAAEQSRVERGL